VIVRIATEDQYEIAGDDYTQLNDLDDAVVAAVEAGDVEAYGKTFAALLDYIRSNGTRLEDADLRESDIIVPPPDTDLAEAARDFTGEGLIPESVLPSPGA
jgi:predicted transcriptional regulator